MNILKLKFILFFLLTLFLMAPSFVNAGDSKLAFLQSSDGLDVSELSLSDIEIGEQESKVNIYFFYSQFCPHCHTEALFLSKLKQEYQNKIEIYAFEIATNDANAQIFVQFGQVYKADVSGVPVVFIGEKHITGYYNDEYTGAAVKNLVEQCLILGCHDLGHHILFPDEECDEEKSGQPCPEDNKKVIKIPIIGEINLQSLSLAGATVVLGALDGFNPCAMWVLIFLISLLLGIKSIKRRWALGLTFIAASSVVYFLFMAAWLNMFLFIGYLLIVRVIIGGLAISFGVYSLRKYIKNKAGVCEVTSLESRRKILEKLKTITLNTKLLPAVIGIILLAFAVNLIELACSAGFPAIYTKILAAHNLSSLNYYLYLLLYIIIFMLDDMIVFTLAMITLRLVGVEIRYAKYSNLIGGVVILILGILLILKPGWLMFG